MNLFLIDNPYLSKILKIIVLILSYFLAKFLINKSINLLFKNIEEKAILVQKERLRTIRSLLKNTAYYALFIIILLLILQEMGMNITPLITGAGILGLAFSFGAQTLVRDLIAGFFIILENQYNVGDQIRLNTEEGTVDKITLRNTVLKDKNGNLIYLPNSEIKKVVVIKNKLSRGA
jgi:small conductance mechanosensitive channel